MIPSSLLQRGLGRFWMATRGAACAGGTAKKGLVLGAYDGCEPGDFKLTAAAERFDKSVNGKLSELLKGRGVALGDAQVFTNIVDEFYGVSVGGLGEKGVGYDPMEKIDQCKENIRTAAGMAAIKLQDQGINTVFVEEFTTGEPAAEGAALAVWRYQDLKQVDKRETNVTLDRYGDGDKDDWERGMAKAEAQNLARYLEEVPANLMTPTVFAENAVEALCPCGVQVEVHDKDWIETKRMNAMMSVAKSSCEPPLFLELKYCGGHINDLPVVLIGKGITYDTGGLCLKKCEIMPEYRGDLAGGAVVLATLRCAARMALPLNIIGLVPLAENLIGGYSSRPGDVVIASNGMSVKIEDPDNEGRIMLADAVHFSMYHKPCLAIAVSTMTPGMRKTVGTAASGTYTNSNDVWMEMERAGSETGDRFWRFPSFWKVYQRRVANFPDVDVSNVGVGPGNASQAAAFVKEFYTGGDFAHIDITGTGLLTNDIGPLYLRDSTMSGRPTRSFIQLLYQIACPHDKGDDC